MHLKQLRITARVAEAAQAHNLLFQERSVALSMCHHPRHLHLGVCCVHKCAVSLCLLSSSLSYTHNHLHVVELLGCELVRLCENLYLQLRRHEIASQALVYEALSY